MSIFKDIYDVGLDAIETRMPFNIGIGIREEPPMPCVSITNRTRKSPLFIHAVRIHHGQADYSYSFSLEPFGKQQIEAKDTKDFYLSPVIPIRIARHQIVKSLPAPDTAAPPFDSPADLFRAIAHGNAKDSWIEIDFNEFKEKQFKRGEIKVLFAGVLQKARSKRIGDGEKEFVPKTAVPQSLATLKISASMELRHTEKKQILLVVNALNPGSKIAFIKKVAVVLPRLTLTTVKNPSIQLSPKTSELVAFQNHRIIEIKPDGGLFTWEMILRDNLQYGIDEIEGVMQGKGYVELTSGEKIDFRYLPLPDSAWEVLTAPTASVIDDKTGYKCSGCGSVILVPIGALTAICPYCQHIGDLKLNSTIATQSSQENIATAAITVHKAYLKILDSYENCTLLIEENNAEKLKARQAQFQKFEQAFGLTFQANSLYLPSAVANDIRTIVNDCILYARKSGRIQTLVDIKLTEQGQKVVKTQNSEIKNLGSKIFALRAKVETHFRRLIAGQ
jgi:hypothetical protein